MPATRIGGDYIPESNYAFEAHDETWTLAGEHIDVSLLLPTSATHPPLVIYLPGLGENARAGLPWRRIWAEAGYAVLSFQQNFLMKRNWPAALAEGGDYHGFAADKYSLIALRSRLATLKALLEEVSRRSTNSQYPLFRQIDTARIALAGFDLGAQTAMGAAGEDLGVVRSGMAPADFRAVIALSPYAGFSGTGFEKRFTSIQIPVLSVTSADDTDPYAMVSTPSLHQAPFQYMPAGKKYLLNLASAAHHLIGGQESDDADDQDAMPEARPDSGKDTAPDRARSSGGRRGARTGGRRGEMHVDPANGRAEQIRNVQSVTTAFLDLTVKADPIASEWLGRNARRWLADTAELKTR